MNIVAPLDLDLNSGLQDDVFSLPAREFIEAWAQALSLSEDELSAWDRENLASAIRRGSNRLKVIEALRSRKTIPAETGFSMRNDIRRTPDRLALLDVLVRFAPDDDAAFLSYAFQRICDREPTGAERLELEFDLRGGKVDRRSTIRRITALAQREGHLALWDTLVPDDIRDEPTDARAIPAGFAIDEDGRDTVVFAREIPDRRGWWIGPDMMRQKVRIADGGWVVEEGWLLVGPKRSLQPGRWRLDIDLVQPEQTALALDVVANSGLDVLHRFQVLGPFRGSVVFAIEPDHRFVEFRIDVPKGQGRVWLKPRDISMRRLS